MHSTRVDLFSLTSMQEKYSYLFLLDKFEFGKMQRNTQIY